MSVTRIAMPAPIEAAWDPAGVRLAVVVRGGVAVVDLATAAVRTLTVCRDGRVRRVDRERAEILDWADVDAAYATLAWSPDGERLALCRKDALIVLAAPASA